MIKMERIAQQGLKPGVYQLAYRRLIHCIHDGSRQPRRGSIIAPLLSFRVGGDGGTTLRKAGEQAERESAPKPDFAELGQRWVGALLQGRVDDVMSLSDVPFNWDGKKIVPTRDELRKLLDSVVEDKGARTIRVEEAFLVPAADTARAAERFALLQAPSLIYCKAVIGDEGVLVAIRPGKTPKVAGFRD
jgi:hypothetical protein